MTTTTTAQNTTCDPLTREDREEITRHMEFLHDCLACAHETYKARAMWAQMGTCAEAMAELDRAKADIAQDRGARAFERLELVQTYLVQLNQPQEVRA